MPPTLITRSLDEVRAFQAEHGDIVIKPLHGNAGSAVFRIRADGANLAALTELFEQVWVEPFMVQAFIKERSEEHTSELQSLMRISYAVFCLKKNKNKHTYPTQQQAPN